ncbi:MAG: Na/Pi symporter [Oscillospiraceae bacterium]|nr:Na/Pi symporter [Oscillospiraceae bacterium]
MRNFTKKILTVVTATLILALFTPGFTDFKIYADTTQDTPLLGIQYLNDENSNANSSEESNSEADGNSNEDSNQASEDSEENSGEEKQEEKKSNPALALALAVFTVACGLAFFLYGMKMMSDGLEAAAGSRFKNILEMVTKNRLVGVITGALITALVQSSSATTVMVVGFVNAGLLSLVQSVGVIMGANIGTTITGLIVSLKIGDYAPLLVAIGLFMIIMTKRDKIKFQGQILAGLGILFLGMTMMGDTLKPLSKNETALSVFEMAQNPLIGILIGLVFTAVIQSSSATIGILVTLGGAGLFGLDSAIYVIYGACIGTCVTAIIASIGATKMAKRVSVAHLAFNVIGTTIFTVITIASMGGLVNLIVRIVGDDVGRQIAIATVVFKVTTTILLFPFAGYLVKIAYLVIPEKETEDSDAKRLLHLDVRILNTPHVAVGQTFKEVERMARLSLENYKLSIDTFLNRNPNNTETIKKNEEIINFLNHEITKFLVKVGALDLEEQDRKVMGSLFHVVNDIERIGDHAENIMEFSLPFMEDEKLFSTVAMEELKDVSDAVQKVLEDAIDTFVGQHYDKEEIDKVAAEEDEVDHKVQQFKDNHVARLNKGVCSAASGMLFVNMLGDLERVSDHALNIANPLRIGKSKRIPT